MYKTEMPAILHFKHALGVMENLPQERTTGQEHPTRDDDNKFAYRCAKQAGQIHEHRFPGTCQHKGDSEIFTEELCRLGLGKPLQESETGPRILGHLNSPIPARPDYTMHALQ